MKKSTDSSNRLKKTMHDVTVVYHDVRVISRKQHTVKDRANVFHTPK